MVSGRPLVTGALERLRLLDSSALDLPNAPQTPEQLNSLYDGVFEQFDSDHNGSVEPEEFRRQMRDILLAIADGLGTAPLQVRVDERGFLADVVKHEAQQLLPAAS